MPGVLRVKASTVAECGQQLSTTAGQLPTTLTTLGPAASGDDALSAAALARQREVEATLVQGLPITDEAAAAGGQKVVQAAYLYGSADERLGAGLGKHTFTPVGG